MAVRTHEMLKANLIKHSFDSQREEEAAPEGS